MPDPTPEFTSTIAIEVELPNQIVLPGTSLHADLCSRITDRVSSIAKTLNVPGTVTVAVSSTMPETTIASTVIRVNGKRCRFPAQLVARLESYYKEDAVSSQTLQSSPAPRAMASLLADLTAQAITRQPGVLFAEPQLSHYLHSAGEQFARLGRPPSDIVEVAGALLGLRLPIPEPAALLTAFGTNMAITSVIEDFVAKEAADIAGIAIAGEYLEQLRADSGDWAAALSLEIQEMIFRDLGLLCPGISVSPDESLQGHAITVRLNRLAGPPTPVLSVGQSFVYDTPERLALLSIEAQTGFDPNTSAPGAVVSAQAGDTLVEAGYLPLSPTEYIALAVFAQIRENAELLVNSITTGFSLATMRSDFPTLMYWIDRDYNASVLTSILRNLIRRQIPLGDRNILFERLLETACASPPACRYAVLADPLSTAPLSRDGAFDLMQFLATGLSRQIGAARSNHTSTVVTYLVDKQVETLLLSPVAEGDENEILRAVEAELKTLPSTALVPNILLDDDAAQNLRSLLRHTFPRMHAIGFSELPPDINVQPIARISLS
jgi:hypothetical protein